MIETTHIRLEKAAEMLGTDADTLLIAASEGRIALYVLINQSRHAMPYGELWEGFAESHLTNPLRHWFLFVRLSRHLAVDLLDRGETEICSFESESDENGTTWATHQMMMAGADEILLKIELSRVFLKRDDVKAIIEQGKTPDPCSVPDEPNPRDRAHVSNALALTNQAARQWWANASQDDPATHPKNADVAAWLIDRGLTPTQAQSAARIIRPEWAHNGRKPDA